MCKTSLIISIKSVKDSGIYEIGNKLMALPFFGARDNLSCL